MDEETQDVAEEAPTGETAPEESPADAQPEPAPEDAAPADEPSPAPEPASREPEGFLLVEYRQPPGTDTPVYQAGRYWHGGSHYALPASVARELEQQHQGFAVVGPATAPATRTP